MDEGREITPTKDIHTQTVDSISLYFVLSTNMITVMKFEVF